MAEAELATMLRFRRLPGVSTADLRANEGVFAPTLSKSFESDVDSDERPPGPLPEGKT